MARSSFQLGFRAVFRACEECGRAVLARAGPEQGLQFRKRGEYLEMQRGTGNRFVIFYNTITLGNVLCRFSGHHQHFRLRF